MIGDLKYKLKNMEEELQTANKCENTSLKTMQYYCDISILSAVLSMKERFISALLLQEHRKDIELKEMRRRVGDLEEFVESHLPSSLVYTYRPLERGKTSLLLAKKLLLNCIFLPKLFRHFPSFSSISPAS